MIQMPHDGSSPTAQHEVLPDQRTAMGERAARSRNGGPAGHDDVSGFSLFAPRRPRAPRLVRLLEAEPRIAGELSGDALIRARDQLLVPYLDVGAQPWTPDPAIRRGLAVLVLEGKLLCANGSGGADLALVGPGDLLDARHIDRDAGWQAVEPARLAMIDARFLIAARAWPQLVAGLLDAVFASSVEQRELAAVAKVSRIEDRVLLFMSRLMARWGTVGPEGLVVTLPVTHQVLGGLVGARRPTVSLALAALGRQGLLRRLDRSRWWMPADAAATVVPQPAAAVELDLGPELALGAG